MRRYGLASWKPYCIGCGSFASSPRRAVTPDAVAWFTVISCATSGRAQSASTAMASMDDPIILAVFLVISIPFSLTDLRAHWVSLARSSLRNSAGDWLEHGSSCLRSSWAIVIRYLFEVFLGR